MVFLVARGGGLLRRGRRGGPFPAPVLAPASGAVEQGEHRVVDHGGNDQGGYTLAPLSAWGKGNYTAPKGEVDPTIDMHTPPPVQIANMDGATYFARFAEILKANPPGPFDYPMVHGLERVDFNVGQSFDLNASPPNVRQAQLRIATADFAVQSGRQWRAAANGGWIAFKKRT